MNLSATTDFLSLRFEYISVPCNATITSLIYHKTHYSYDQYFVWFTQRLWNVLVVVIPFLHFNRTTQTCLVLTSITQQEFNLSPPCYICLLAACLQDQYPNYYLNKMSIIYALRFWNFLVIGLCNSFGNSWFSEILVPVCPAFLLKEAEIFKA